MYYIYDEIRISVDDYDEVLNPENYDFDLYKEEVFRFLFEFKDQNIPKIVKKWSKDLKNVFVYYFEIDEKIDDELSIALDVRNKIEEKIADFQMVIIDIKEEIRYLKSKFDDLEKENQVEDYDFIEEEKEEIDNEIEKLENKVDKKEEKIDELQNDLTETDDVIAKLNWYKITW